MFKRIRRRLSWLNCSCAVAFDSLIVSLLVASLGRSRGEGVRYRRPGAATRGCQQAFLKIHTIMEEE